MRSKLLKVALGCGFATALVAPARACEFNKTSARTTSRRPSRNRRRPKRLRRRVAAGAGHRFELTIVIVGVEIEPAAARGLRRAFLARRARAVTRLELAPKIRGPFVQKSAHAFRIVVASSGLALQVALKVELSIQMLVGDAASARLIRPNACVGPAARRSATVCASPIRSWSSTAR